MKTAGGLQLPWRSNTSDILLVANSKKVSVRTASYFCTAVGVRCCHPLAKQFTTAVCQRDLDTSLPPFKLLYTLTPFAEHHSHPQQFQHTSSTNVRVCKTLRNQKLCHCFLFPSHVSLWHCQRSSGTVRLTGHDVVRSPSGTS